MPLKTRIGNDTTTQCRHAGHILSLNSFFDVAMTADGRCVGVSQIPHPVFVWTHMLRRHQEQKLHALRAKLMHENIFLCHPIDAYKKILVLALSAGSRKRYSSCRIWEMLFSSHFM